MPEENDVEFEEWYEWAEPVFIGLCTCAHPVKEHGFQHCGINSCDCKAGWIDNAENILWARNE